MIILTQKTDLATKLWRYRTDRGLSYREAGEQIGIPHSIVHDIEHRKKDPRWSTVRKILIWMSDGPAVRGR